MTGEDPYRVAPLTMNGAEFERVSALLLRVFPKARHLTPGYLAWKYAQNPDGAAVAFSAFADDALVGHLGGMALVARIDGRLQRGLLLLNSAIHADHRRRSLMSRLSEAIFAEGARRGFSFSISTGNRYSSKPLMTRYKPLGLLEARIGIGWPRRAESAAPPSFERVWSEEALRWRLANPEARYSVRRHGAGITVGAATGLPGVGALLYQGPGEAPPSNGPNSGPLGVWLGRDPGIDWRRSTFLPIAARLRPSPLNLFYRDLTGGGFVPDPDRLVIQALDFDAY